MVPAFFANWGGAFGDAWKIARVLPLLILAIAGIEFAQHVVELHLGFFSVDPAIRKSASMEPLRMAFGWPKMLILWAVGFFVMRYCVIGDAGLALRPSSVAMRRYLWVIVFQLVPFAAILYAEPILAALGLPADRAMTFRGIFGLGQQLIEPLLVLWFVNAAMGTHAFGPVTSARTIRWLYPWALALMVLARVPVGTLHQYLNRWPAGQGPATQWTLLAIDALVVGILAVVVPAVQVRIARYVADRRGLALLDGAVSAKRQDDVRRGASRAA